MSPMQLTRTTALIALTLPVVLACGATQAAPTLGGPKTTPDVIYVPTPPPVVDRMLDLARVGPDDVVYDLGCGDGRIPVAAVLRGAKRAVCVDIDPARIAEARDRAARAGVSDRIEFIQGDLFEVDFSDATVITLYLLPQLNMRLRPTLMKMPPGTRVVSHDFDMGDWEPDRAETVANKRVYLWTIAGQGARQQAKTAP